MNGKPICAYLNNKKVCYADSSTFWRDMAIRYRPMPKQHSLQAALLMMQERAVEPIENVPKIMMQERAVETTENVILPNLQENSVNVSKIMMQERAVEPIENVSKY